MKKLIIFVIFAFSLLLLSSCGSFSNMVTIKINNQSAQAIVGKLYVVNEAITESITVSSKGVYESTLLFTEIVKSFESQGYHEGSLSFNVDDKSIGKIILSGYIEPAFGNIKGKVINVNIKEDLTYKVEIMGK